MGQGDEGGLGGALFAAVFVPLTGQGVDILLLLGGIFGVAGATCAAGSLALARMAEHEELLETGSDVDDVGLTVEEERELLGGDG